MKNILNKSIKLILIGFILSFLFFLISNFKVAATIYLFVYFLSFLLIPYWVRSKLKLTIKLLLTTLLGVVGIVTIACLYGVGKALRNFIIVLFTLIIGSVIANVVELIWSKSKKFHS